ncbi:MAG: hypothetical protein PHC66_02160 [Candidatus Nanoarchaeia archaeon]|nr:hypothetical protein [Candidatus Nanoarchaeia archaeon]MDD5239723.1 hypothetical protein [Candidatus Nanoarchaeia archaeon]
MVYDTEGMKVISVIPRCQTCSRHTVYIVKNKKSGEAKYFCALCGPLEILKYHNNSDWDTIVLK